jgi:hypothetical protein
VGCLGLPVENLWKTTEPSEIQFYTADAAAREDSLGWARYNHRNVKNCVNNDKSVGRTESGGLPLNVDSLQTVYQRSQLPSLSPRPPPYSFFSPHIPLRFPIGRSVR